MLASFGRDTPLLMVRSASGSAIALSGARLEPSGTWLAAIPSWAEKGALLLSL